MGLRAQGLDPIAIAKEAVSAPGEKLRRQTAAEAMRLYEDDAQGIFENDLNEVIGDRTRRGRISKFATMAACLNLFKRTVDDTVRPVYAVAPNRRISQGDPKGFAALYAESRINEAHETALAYADAMGECWVGFRYVGRLEVAVVDIVPVSGMTVWPDRDDPKREGAVILDVPVVLRTASGTKQALHRVYQDDEEIFRLDENFNLYPIDDRDGNPTLVLDRSNGHPGVIPGFMIHRYDRPGRYWNATAGRDRISAQKAINFCAANALRLIKTQGHTQTALNGDPANFPKDQVLDPEVPIMAGEGNTITVLHNPTDPMHFLKVAEFIMLGTGGNYGFNRALLNAIQKDEADMVALLERRKQVTKLANWVEQKTFEKLKVISKAHSDEAKRIPDEATLSVDFAEHLSSKGDRKVQLETWEMEVKKGIRSVYDIVRSDNPELTSDEEAKAEIERNIDSYAWLVEILRARNISLNAEAGEPGQDARANGAMGPPVRDGKMTRDEADEAARTGTTEPS